MKSLLHPLKTIYIIFALFIANTSIAQLWSQYGKTLYGDSLWHQYGWRVCISADGNRIAISTTSHDKILENQFGSWIQLGNNISGETTYWDGSGRGLSLSADGTTVAIGADYHEGGQVEAGQVRIYRYLEGTWVQLGNDINGEASEDHSGRSVSLNANGNIVAIGAPFNDESFLTAGHTRIFEYLAGAWIQIGNDIDGEAEDDGSGLSVSLNSDGTRVAIGEPGNDGNGEASGQVRVFENQGGAWIQTGEDILGENAGDQSGNWVSLTSDGNILAIGAKNNDGNDTNSGHVRIYEYQAGTWLQRGTDINGEEPGDKFGWSVSLNSNGTIVAIGSLSASGISLKAGDAKVYITLREYGVS